MRKPLPIILFACLLTLSFSSCKKSSSSGISGNFYIQAKFDGSAKAFNSTVSALKSNLGNGDYTLIIAGLGTNEQISLSLWSDKDDFTAGKTFTLNALGGTAYNILAYIAPLGSSDPMSQWTSVYDYGTVSESFQCTITEATSAYVKGTFSGLIYENNSSAVFSKNVTEGEFYAKY